MKMNYLNSLVILLTISMCVFGQPLSSESSNEGSPTVTSIENENVMTETSGGENSEIRSEDSSANNGTEVESNDKDSKSKESTEIEAKVTEVNPEASEMQTNAIMDTTMAQEKTELSASYLPPKDSSSSSSSSEEAAVASNVKMTSADVVTMESTNNMKSEKLNEEMEATTMAINNEMPMNSENTEAVNENQMTTEKMQDATEVKTDGRTEKPQSTETPMNNEISPDQTTVIQTTTVTAITEMTEKHKMEVSTKLSDMGTPKPLKGTKSPMMDGEKKDKGNSAIKITMSSFVVLILSTLLIVA
jgi:hypothetical protein